MYIDSNLINWCQIVKDNKLKPIVPRKLIGGVVFIKKIGSSNRCIVIKIINGEFKEIHLGDHTYYNKLRKALGLKKGSKEY